MTDVHAMGPIQVRALTDATGEVFKPVREAFPDAPDTAWQVARRLDPEAFDPSGRWRLRFRCFLITTGRHTILVDAGVGPCAPPANWSWSPVPLRSPRGYGHSTPLATPRATRWHWSSTTARRWR